jgi:aminoglycoside 3-N-acetyltransferase I
MDLAIKQLGTTDTALMECLNAMFAAVFEDLDTYSRAKPSQDYLARILAMPHVIALAGIAGDAVVGGLVAYELPKLEQARSEIYIYDLAVAEAYRRRGVASRLIAHTQLIAKERGAWVIFVQGDYGDAPALALYDKLGTREEVLHFDIAVK